LLQAHVRKPHRALLFGDNHFNNLPPSANEIVQKPRRFIRKRADFRLRCHGETSDDYGIDRIGFGALAKLCVAKSKSGRIGDEVRRGLRVI
jgi:hypothetical protein